MPQSYHNKIIIHIQNCFPFRMQRRHGLAGGQGGCGRENGKDAWKEAGYPLRRQLNGQCPRSHTFLVTPDLHWLGQSRPASDVAHRLGWRPVTSSWFDQSCQPPINLRVPIQPGRRRLRLLFISKNLFCCLFLAVVVGYVHIIFNRVVEDFGDLAFALAFGCRALRGRG